MITYTALKNVDNPLWPKKICDKNTQFFLYSNFEPNNSSKKVLTAFIEFQDWLSTSYYHRRKRAYKNPFKRRISMLQSKCLESVQSEDFIKSASSLLFSASTKNKVSLEQEAFVELYEAYNDENYNPYSSLALLDYSHDKETTTLKSYLKEIFFRIGEFTQFIKQDSYKYNEDHEVDFAKSKKFFQCLIYHLYRAKPEVRQQVFHQHLTLYKEEPFALDKNRDFKTLSCLLSLYGNIKSLEFIKNLFPLKVYLNAPGSPSPLVLSCLNGELFKLEIFHHNGLETSLEIIKKELRTKLICPEEYRKLKNALHWLSGCTNKKDQCEGNKP